MPKMQHPNLAGEARRKKRKPANRSRVPKQPDRTVLLPMPSKTEEQREAVRLTRLEYAMLGKACPGKVVMVKHLKGAAISRAGAIKAKCYDCCAGYADGKKDCKVRSCPLYPFMPYREKEEV